MYIPCMHTCICNKPFNNSTIIVENSFFTKLDDHTCKIEPILETQYLTAMTRTMLTKAGINRTEQLFAKSLLDHLHRNRLDTKQAQYLVNKLAQLTDVYGAKVGRSFKSLDINNSNFIDNITKSDGAHETLPEDCLKGEKGYLPCFTTVV